MKLRALSLLVRLEVARSRGLVDDVREAMRVADAARLRT